MKKIIYFILILCMMLALVACGKDKEEEETTPEETTPEETTTREPLTEEDYRRYGVDELNSAPILMYHRIYDMKNSETEYTGGNVDVDGYNRTAEAFEADLEYYYAHGYRMVRLTDYLDGYVDVPLGYSPIMITFDDGLQDTEGAEVHEDGSVTFSPNSAIGILERMKAKYPDFNVTATFFLNIELFNDEKGQDEAIIKWMVENGYDIGNHTANHYMIPDLTADEIEEEVGRVYKRLEEIIPGQYVNIIALPFGYPTDTSADEKYEKLFNGTYEGFTYHTKATLLCSWMRENSPFSTGFDLTYVKRIRGYDNNGEDFDIEYNFNELENGTKYISDGDPNTIVIHEEDEEGLGETYGHEVIMY